MKMSGINLLLATIWLALLVSYSNQNQQQSDALRDHQQHIHTRMKATATATTTIRSHRQQEQQLRDNEYRERTELAWQRSMPTHHARHTHTHKHQHKEQQQQCCHGNQHQLRQQKAAEQKQQQHNYDHNQNYHNHHDHHHQHHQKHERSYHHKHQQQQSLHPGNNAALPLSKNSVQNAYSVSTKHSHSQHQNQRQQQQPHQPDGLLHEVSERQEKNHQQYYNNDGNSGRGARPPMASGHIHAHNYSKLSSLVSDAPTTVAANTMPSVDSATVASVDVDDDVKQESKSKLSLSDATSRHNFKASPHRELHAAPFKPTPEGIDYAADDYYDVDTPDEQEQDQEYETGSLDTDTEEDERLINKRANSLSKQEYARVTRDHGLTDYQSYDHHFSYEALNQQDYADDEPYNPAEQEGSAPGDLTKQKIDELGTEEAVQQSHDKYMKEQRQRQRTPAQLAAEHISRMDSVGRCRRPLPRVVPVSDETSKVFRPSCTWLHRCGPDTGCCRSEWEVCTNKSYENVQVYVYVYSISTGRSEIEVRTLENHTECHCVNRSYIPRYKRSGFAQSPLPLSASNNHDAISDDELDEDYWNDHCHCPTHFDALSDDMELQQPEQQQPSSTNLWRHTTHNTPDRGRSSCRCDCYDNNMPCQRLKRGEEGFAVVDRKCIAERRCRTPTCAHGDYSLQTGRCPRQRAHKRASTHHHNGVG